jgi:hypothetical protein
MNFNAGIARRKIALSDPDGYPLGKPRTRPAGNGLNRQNEQK